MAGSDERGIGYDLAVALLGYTHGALLDDVVDAFASGDAATVFRAVDRVIQTGQDPRRFVEDLLERFRDLIIVNAVPESAGNILHGMPQDQIARLRNQASQLGASELSRAADITNTALTEMTGATSPQLHLELLRASWPEIVNALANIRRVTWFTAQRGTRSPSATGCCA